MSTADTLVQDYLGRLWVAAVGLAPDQRDELMTGIHEHIESGRRLAGDGGEAATRNVLDRLGDPSDIVAAAGEDPAAAPPVVGRRAWGGLEVAAMLVLGLGWERCPASGRRRSIRRCRSCSSSPRPAPSTCCEGCGPLAPRPSPASRASLRPPRPRRCGWSLRA